MCVRACRTFSIDVRKQASKHASTHQIGIEAGEEGGLHHRPRVRVRVEVGCWYIIVVTCVSPTKPHHFPSIRPVHASSVPPGEALAEGGGSRRPASRNSCWNCRRISSTWFLAFIHACMHACMHAPYETGNWHPSSQSLKFCIPCGVCCWRGSGASRSPGPGPAAPPPSTPRTPTAAPVCANGDRHRHEVKKDP